MEYLAVYAALLGIAYGNFIQEFALWMGGVLAFSVILVHDGEPFLISYVTIVVFGTKEGNLNLQICFLLLIKI